MLCISCKQIINGELSTSIFVNFSNIGKTSSIYMYHQFPNHFTETVTSIFHSIPKWSLRHDVILNMETSRYMAIYFNCNFQSEKTHYADFFLASAYIVKYEEFYI